MVTHTHTYTQCMHTCIYLMQATIISDVIVLYVLKSRNYYRQKKYLNVANPTTGDYDIIDSPDDDKETVSQTSFSIAEFLGFPTISSF